MVDDDNINNMNKILCKRDGNVKTCVRQINRYLAWHCIIVIVVHFVYLFIINRSGLWHFSLKSSSHDVKTDPDAAIIF